MPDGKNIYKVSGEIFLMENDHLTKANSLVQYIS